MQIFECEQSTDEWHSLRVGLPTTSMFATIMAKNKNGQPSATRKMYMLKLLAERHTGISQETYSNEHMERGKALEPEARSFYELITGNDVHQVGFITDGRIGCSPDGLIGDDGLVEIKTKLPHLQMEVCLENRVPPEHIAQIQGQLWVTERKWCDFMSYCSKEMPYLIVRVERDEAYIEQLAFEVNKFIAELEGLQEKIAQRALEGV